MRTAQYLYMLFILWRVFKGFFFNIGVKLWLQPPMKHQPCETQSCHYWSNHICWGWHCGQTQRLINSLIMCFTKEKEQNTKTQTHHWTSPPVTVSTIHCMLLTSTNYECTASLEPFMFPQSGHTHAHRTVIHMVDKKEKNIRTISFWKNKNKKNQLGGVWWLI